MATFDEIYQQGKVSIMEVIVPDKDKEYRFEYTKYDPDTGDLLPEKTINQFSEQYFLSERLALINQRDLEIARCNNGIAEIDAKLAVIMAIKADKVEEINA